MNVALLVAIVGLLSLLATDQFNSWNKLRYESQKKAGVSDREAFRYNRRRKVAYDRFTFWALALAAGLSIYSSFADKQESDKAIETLTRKFAKVETELRDLQKQLTERDAEAVGMESRVKQIETQLTRSQSDSHLGKVASLERTIRSLGRRVALLERKLRSIDSKRSTK
jgi:peptidoglycan hydrolase CwlO-like protein